ncbi:MAG: putative phosphoesterase [Clostridiaceae bacterium]|nr:putative phosphoesterase [Clostridiaceae bacterium]
MERYVIVCLIKGSALEFYEKLVSEVCSKFNVKPQRLPAHFTIKAPFEIEHIKPIENAVEEFVKSNSKQEASIEGFGKFRDSVVFMKIDMPKEGVKVHDDFIDKLKTIPNLEWKANEGREKVFHCTVVTRIRDYKFKDIWEYVNMHNASFKIYFDNISILRWNRDRWVTYREYNLK